MDYTFDCLVVRSTYKSNVMLRGQMNVSSMIFQSSAVVIISILRCGFLLHIARPTSVPKFRYKMDTLLRSACIHGLSPHMIPISNCFWHQFSQINCVFLAWRSRSDCADEPLIVFSWIGSKVKWTFSGLDASGVSNAMFSFATLGNFACISLFSHFKGGSALDFPRKVQNQVEFAFALLTAPCRTQSIFCTWFCNRNHYQNISWVNFCGECT